MWLPAVAVTPIASGLLIGLSSSVAENAAWFDTVTPDTLRASNCDVVGVASVTIQIPLLFGSVALRRFKYWFCTTTGRFAPAESIEAVAPDAALIARSV